MITFKLAAASSATSDNCNARSTASGLIKSIMSNCQFLYSKECNDYLLHHYVRNVMEYLNAVMHNKTASYKTQLKVMTGICVL